MDDDTDLHCPECEGTDFREEPAITNWGRTYVLICENDDCGWVVAA